MRRTLAWRGADCPATGVGGGFEQEVKSKRQRASGPFKRHLTQSSLCQQFKVAVSSYTCSSEVVQNDENRNLFPFWNDYWVRLKVTGIPHRESQALVTTIRQAGGFAAISWWLSASDTTGLWNNKDAHPGRVPPLLSIERFSINANGRRCDPSGVRSFSPQHTGGGATSLSTPG